MIHPDIRIERYPQNTRGRDYAVGDIHGHFTELSEALERIGFDPAVDRLFSAGDLVDRGPESNHFDQWLEKPWFHAVLGNHEMHFSEGIGNNNRNYRIAGCDKWFWELEEARQLEIIKACSSLPIAIEIETARGPVVIVHASLPTPTWEEFQELIEQKDLYAIHNSVWDRHDLRSMMTSGLPADDHQHNVPDVVALIHGHQPLKEALSFGNRHYIDTGMGLKPFGQEGGLTIIDISRPNDPVITRYAG